MNASETMRRVTRGGCATFAMPETASMFVFNFPKFTESPSLNREFYAISQPWFGRNLVAYNHRACLLAVAINPRTRKQIDVTSVLPLPHHHSHVVIKIFRDNLTLNAGCVARGIVKKTLLHAERSVSFHFASFLDPKGATSKSRSQLE